MSIISKVTHGFVIQTYETDGKCIAQEFIAGDDCSWEDEEGSIIEEPSNAEYMPYHMVQSNDLSYDELVTVLEVARVALADAGIYDEMADQLDLSDEYLKDLQEKLRRIGEEKVDV